MVKVTLIIGFIIVISAFIRDVVGVGNTAALEAAGDRFSSRANVKFNQSPGDLNDQWLPVQPIGAININDWALTIAEVNLHSGQVPLQWTHPATITESTPLDIAAIEAPASFYYLAELGAKNPNEYTILFRRDSYADFLAVYNKYTARRPGIFVGFVSDRDLFLDADLPKGN